MRFEWDRNKARSNLSKHSISFEEAATVFGDPFSRTISDALHSGDEDRFIMIGRSYRLKLAVVVFTERHGNVRIISALPASRKERGIYEENF